MYPLSLPSKLWFFTIISFILSVSANPGNITSCGAIKEIGYPFWGLDSRPEGCGYPGFQLNCNKGVPEISIMSANYRVNFINSYSQILGLARVDYSDGICPTSLINSTFESTPFRYNTNTTRDIRLYYGCQSLARQVNLTSDQLSGISSEFDCTINKTEVIGYYVTRNITVSDFGVFASAINTTLGSCNDNVVVPVLNSQVELLEQYRNSDTLKEALKLGFELQWSANDSLCSDCLNSSGECGYNVISAEFTCYCQDGPYPKVCPSSSPGKKKNRSPLVAGVAVGGAVFGILLGIAFLWLRQRRKKTAVAQAESRDFSTPHSSKGLPTSTTTTLSQSQSYTHSNPSYSVPNPKYDLEKGSTYFGAHVFNYEELLEATDNFNPSKQLGEGGFGSVYHGVLHDGRVVAVKRLYESNFKRVDQYMNEILILTRIRHPNLVTLYGCTSKRSRELLLVYEYIPNGTVADHLHGNLSNSGLLTWRVRLSIAVETATALAYLHAAEIIHRDVKTNNILLENNFQVKVADFGLSRLFPNNVTHVSTAPQGTPGYVDPEYYQCYQLTEKSDVYSFGVVLIELISAKQAVDTSRSRFDINLANMAVSRIQNHALHELVDPSLGFEGDYGVKSTVIAVAELAFRCLRQERDMRPTMAEVLEILKRIQNQELGDQKADVVDIRSDDVCLLKQQIPPPFSPDPDTDKWTKIRSM